MIEVVDRPIRPAAVTRRVRKDSHGAVVTFLGTVRSPSEGKRVLYLEYETYPGLAEKKLQQVVQEIKEKWNLEAVAISHRVGRLEVGDIAVVIAVAAPHRHEAFAACEYAIERIKAMVPIWKKEVFEDGARWVGGE